MKIIDQLDETLSNSRYVYKKFIHLPEISAIVYYSEIIENDPKTSFMAMGYRNKRKTWSFLKRFESKEAMFSYIETWKNYLMNKKTTENI